MADFYAARDRTTPPLLWPSIAPPFTAWEYNLDSFDAFTGGTETEEGQSLAEAKIKQMTGGDTLKGRPLYGSYVEFKITGKLWLATNSLPQINNSDHGIWRRIMAIPFNRTFTAQEQDKALQSKLMVELPGILN